MKKPTKRAGKVKAWAIIRDGAILEGTLLEKDYDCACQAFSYQSAAIFGRKADALSYRGYAEKVVPVIITYTP